MLNLFKCQEKTQKLKIKFWCSLKIGKIKEILQYAHENPDKSHAEVAKFFTMKFRKEIHRLVVERLLERRDVYARMPEYYNNVKYYINGYYYDLQIEDMKAEERAALNLAQMSDWQSYACEGPTSPVAQNESPITEE